MRAHVSFHKECYKIHSDGVETTKAKVSSSLKLPHNHHMSFAPLSLKELKQPESK